MFRFLTALLFAAFLAGCAGDGTSRSTGEFVDDATLVARVKTQLFESKDTSGFAINVDAYRGKVQLNGFVDSATAKRRAEEIARNVQGVRAVTNNLEVTSDVRR